MARTLADMAPEEREQCRGLWCDYLTVNGEVIQVIYRWEKDGLASVHDPKTLDERTNQYVMVRSLTPRFDLMRTWNPDGTPVPANVSYDIQGHRETTDEWVDFFGTRRCTLRRAKRDLAEAREEKPNIKWRLAMRHEPHLMAIPDDYQEPGEGDE